MSGGMGWPARAAGTPEMVEPGCIAIPRTCRVALPPAGIITEVVGTVYSAPAEAAPKPPKFKTPPDREAASKAKSARQ